MRPRTHRKQVLLFLIAVVLPSLALVALTLRMIGQERELAEKRRAEERRRLASEIGQQLLVRLEKIKLQEVSALESQVEKHRGWKYVNPEVVLLASKSATTVAVHGGGGLGVKYRFASPLVTE
ncbi:MAG: hypothetical protein ACE5MK_08945 [Acidobacteriota bacterium]